MFSDPHSIFRYWWTGIQKDLLRSSLCILILVDMRFKRMFSDPHCVFRYWWTGIQKDVLIPSLCILILVDWDSKGCSHTLTVYFDIGGLGFKRMFSDPHCVFRYW